MSTCRRAAVLALFLLSIISIAVVGSPAALGAGSDEGYAEAIRSAGGDERYAEAIRTARSAIWRDINTGRASSGTVAILDNGTVVYAEGFGAADREQSIPVTPETRFNIGSVSKVFVAVAVMLLVDEGKIDLDAPVIDYLPEFVMDDPRYTDITVRMLLSHTSGLNGTVYANNFGYASNPHVHDDTLQALSTARLRHAPGAMAVYTNDGFTLAEMIVERVSGRKYIEFLEERVFAPLALERTGLGVGEVRGEPSAAYYHPATGKKEPPEAVALLGSGGLGSTAVDLVRFADTFSASGVHILSSAARREMRAAQPDPFNGQLRRPGLPYGLGWDMTDIPRYREKGIQVLGKSGGTFQFTSMLYTVPDYGISVAVIEAGQGANAGAIALDVLDAVLVGKGLIEPKDPVTPWPLEPEPIPGEYIAYEGYYIGDDGALFRIDFDEDTNVVTISLVSDGTVQPVSTLVYRDGYFYEQGDPERRSYFAVVGDRVYYVSPFIGFDMIRYERLPEISHPRKLAIDVTSTVWLRRNVKPYEAMLIAGEHIVQPREVPGFPGYVDFRGVKAIESATYARMPAEAIRDQTELRLVDHDGKVWAHVYDMLFSTADEARPLATGETAMTIGDRGYNEWLVASEDAVVSFRMPEGGRVIVFSPDGMPVYDSVVDEGDVFVARGSYVELVGRPGDTFRVIAAAHP